MDKFIIGFDLHDQFADKRTVDAFFEFTKSFKPTIRGLGGDIFDLTSLRHGARGEDLNTSLADGYKAGEDFVKRFKPNWALLGNHEDRLCDIVKNGSGPTREYAGVILESMMSLYDSVGATVFDYNKRSFVELGNYKVIHGFHCGQTAIRNHANSYGGNVIHGHVHAPATWSPPMIDDVIAYSAPCMCQVDYEYNRRMTATLAHKNGWVFGIIKRNGKCEVNLVVKDEETDSFYCPTAYKEF